MSSPNKPQSRLKILLFNFKITNQSSKKRIQRSKNELINEENKKSDENKISEIKDENNQWQGNVINFKKLLKK